MKKLTCWIIGEGLIGTENQCLGVADHLGLAPVIKRIRLREPWKSLSPLLGFEQWWSFDPLLMPPWPDLVLAGGRKAIAPARYIRKASGGKSFTVFFQNPKCSLNHFDLVIAPEHDRLSGENVVQTLGAPNRITIKALNKATEAFPKLKALPSMPEKPRIAVLIGGNSKTHTITQPIIKALVRDLKALDAALMITISRRTPAPFIKALRNAFKDHPDCIFWASPDTDGPNPYQAYLGLADAIIATNDSVSMLSDAGTTGKPVHVVDLDGGSRKFTDLYKTLKKRGVIRPFAGKLENWDYAPLNDAQKVANVIETRLKEKRRDNE